MQWAVFAELVAVFSVDTLAAIEGIAFDAFGASEVQAKKATSLQLSVWTINLALSCTIGGIVYDAFGWTGIAAVHTTLAGLLTLVFSIHPACRESFMQFAACKVGDSADSADVESTASTAENGASKEMVFAHVIPGTAERTTQLAGVTEEAELQIEEVGSEADEADSTQSHGQLRSPVVLLCCTEGSAVHHFITGSSCLSSVFWNGINPPLRTDDAGMKPSQNQGP